MLYDKVVPFKTQSEDANKDDILFWKKQSL
jgi:hypothetical protein